MISWEEARRLSKVIQSHHSVKAEHPPHSNAFQLHHQSTGKWNTDAHPSSANTAKDGTPPHLSPISQKFDISLDNVTKEPHRGVWLCLASLSRYICIHHHLHKLSVAGGDNWHLNAFSSVSAFQWELRFSGWPCQNANKPPFKCQWNLTTRSFKSFCLRYAVCLSLAEEVEEKKTYLCCAYLFFRKKTAEFFKVPDFERAGGGNPVPPICMSALSAAPHYAYIVWSSCCCVGRTYMVI